MRRAGYAIIAAWISCAGVLACSSFSSDDKTVDADAGDAANVPLGDGASGMDAARVREAGTGEILFESFDSPGVGCGDWLTEDVSAIKKDVDGGRVCLVCAASASSSALYKEIPATKTGTYTLTGTVHNVSAVEINARVQVFYADPDGGSQDISASTTGPAIGKTALMQATRSATRPLKSVTISYRLNNMKDGCIEVDDVLLEHTP